jgi:hypothetical protein
MGHDKGSQSEASPGSDYRGSIELPDLAGILALSAQMFPPPGTLPAKQYAAPPASSGGGGSGVGACARAPTPTPKATPTPSGGGGSPSPTPSPAGSPSDEHSPSPS